MQNKASTASGGNIPLAKPFRAAYGPNQMPNSNKSITRQQLLHPDARMVLGQLVAGRLLEHGVCAFFINGVNEVEAVPPLELLLDRYPEGQAIQHLTELGYDQTQLVAYLKGRDLRYKLCSDPAASLLGPQTTPTTTSGG